MHTTTIFAGKLFTIALLIGTCNSFIHGQAPAKLTSTNDTTGTSSPLKSSPHLIGNQPLIDEPLSVAGLPAFVNGQQMINGPLMKPTRIQFKRIVKQSNMKR